MDIKMIDHSLSMLYMNSNKLYGTKRKRITSMPSISENMANSINKKFTLSKKENTLNTRTKNMTPTLFFQTKVKRGYMLDINSLYPFSLINKYYSLHLKKDKPLSDINTHMFIDYMLHTHKKKYTYMYTKLLLNSYYGKMHKRKYFIMTPMLLYAEIFVNSLKAMKNNPPCYSDVDSVMTSHPTKFMLSKSLGQLKCQKMDKLLLFNGSNYTYLMKNSSKTMYKGMLNNLKMYSPKNFISMMQFYYNMYDYK